MDVPIPPTFVEPSTSAPTSPSIDAVHTTPMLAFDPEWLAITRAFNPLMSRGRDQQAYPDEQDARAAVKKELEWVKAKVYGLEQSDAADTPLHVLVKPITTYQKFEVTAPPPDPNGRSDVRAGGELEPSRFLCCSAALIEHRLAVRHYDNPQTAAFCQLLGIDNKIDSTH